MPHATVGDLVGALAAYDLLDRTMPASTRITINGPLPDGMWNPDTYGDLTDNLAKLLVKTTDGEFALDLPFPSP